MGQRGKDNGQDKSTRSASETEDTAARPGKGQHPQNRRAAAAENFGLRFPAPLGSGLERPIERCFSHETARRNLKDSP